MSSLTVALLILGIVLLVAGADQLVSGASRLAAAFGVPPLVIGLTVVAFGTSAPELAVSINSALNGQANITLGNVIGSNISNILLILGLAALIAPIPVVRQILRRDAPLMVVASLAVLLLALDGQLSRIDGVLLLGGLAGYLWLTLRNLGGTTTDLDQLDTAQLRAPRQVAINAARLIGGLVALVIGAGWIVDGAVSLARTFGVSELVVGLTIVAVGTSLPEIATSVLAGLRGQRDIAVGNVVGSNLLNLLAVLALTMVIAPFGIVVPPVALRIDLPVMLASALLCLPLFFTRRQITRTEGGLLIGLYLLYTSYLILSAVEAPITPLFSRVTVFVILPVVVAAVAIRFLRALRAERSADSANPL